MRRPQKGGSAADDRVASLTTGAADGPHPAGAPTVVDKQPQAGMDADGRVDFGALVAGIISVESGDAVARFHDQGVRPPIWLGFLGRVMDADAAEAFAEGLVTWASSAATHEAKRARVGDFRRGFAQFLNSGADDPEDGGVEEAARPKGDEHTGDLRRGFVESTSRPDDLKLALEDISTELIDRFEDWLARKHVTGPVMRTRKMRAFEKVVQVLRLMPRWSGRIDASIDFETQVRKRRPKGIKNTRNKVLAAPVYDALWLAASRKSKRLVSLHERRKAALAEAMDRQPTFDEASADPVALAAWMVREYPSTIPPAHKYITNYQTSAKVPPALWERARRILMPGTDELLPAIIILATVFALNPGVVKGFRHRTDYRVGTTMGRRRLFISPMKNRPRPKKQRNSVVATEDMDNPARVIRFVEERTAFLRERMGAPHSRMLFIFLMIGGANSFLATDTPLDRSVAKFGKAHRIPGLQLKKLRSSSLDRVHQITGGDLLKVRDVANHESIETTFQDYDTDGVAQRDVERLGNAMLQNGRFLASNGVIRPWLIAPELDQGSATPGYACLDPLKSAIPGEEDGVLCKAYGRCPICPLSALQPTPRAYAYLDALATRIDEALTVDEVVSGPEWIGRWSIVKKSLARQMRLYPPEIVAAAAGETISSLPPME